MIQSFSDIITNSSSEVFIINSNNNEKLIIFIQDICEHLGYNISKIMDPYIADENGSIIYGEEIYRYKKGDLIINSTYDNSIPFIIWQLLCGLSWNKPPIINDIDIKDVTRIHLG